MNRSINEAFEKGVADDARSGSAYLEIKNNF